MCLHIALGTRFEQEIVVVCCAPNVIRRVLLRKVARCASHLKMSRRKLPRRHLYDFFADIDQIEIDDEKRGPVAPRWSGEVRKTFFSECMPGPCSSG